MVLQIKHYNKQNFPKFLATSVASKKWFWIDGFRYEKSIGTAGLLIEVWKCFTSPLYQLSLEEQW